MRDMASRGRTSGEWHAPRFEPWAPTHDRAAPGLAALAWSWLGPARLVFTWGRRGDWQPPGFEAPAPTTASNCGCMARAVHGWALARPGSAGPGLARLYMGKPQRPDRRSSDGRGSVVLRSDQTAGGAGGTSAAAEATAAATASACA